MPTIVTKSIGQTNTPTTMDYSTLQAWEDAIPADLVAADEQWVGECYNQGTFTAPLVITGQVTDATRNIVLKCAAGASFRDNPSVRSVALDLNTSNGVSIVTTTGSSTGAIDVAGGAVYVTLDGLQVECDSGSYHVALGSYSNSIVTATGCIFKQVGGSQAATWLNTLTTLRNCLVIGGVAGDGSAGFGGGARMENCTVVWNNGGTGAYATSSVGNAAVFKNTAVFRWAEVTDGAAVLAGTSDYIATDKGDNAEIGGGAHNLLSLISATQFESVTNDYRLKAGHELKAGTPDANIPTDISGFARDATTPCIGCWEFSSGLRKFVLH